MKKIQLFFLSLFICGMSKADFSIDWMKMPDMLANNGTSIAVDQSNNVYTTTSAGEIVLEKRDRFGNFQWRVNSTTTIQFNYEFPVKVHVDPQGNPVVVGYRHTHSSSGNNANSLIILKYDPSGNLIYKNNYDGAYSYFNNSRYWTNVSSEMDADGNLYVGTAGNIAGYPAGMNIIKIGPGGNLIRVSTKNFPSSTNFHFVSKLSLHKNLVGVTGVTSYSSANSTSWLMDTSGISIWDTIATGVQGRDMLIDDFGNAYVLTWISASSSGDIALYKMDPTGNQLWLKLFDFNGSEISYKILSTSDNNLMILSYGTQTGISYYVDWLLFKADTAGNILWSDRYDEHSNNDETPGAMITDAQGNTFVTGIGGPFPGGSNLGARQMITIKYDSLGTREWVSAIDTLNEYLTGSGIVRGYDSSIFVLGDVNTFIVHYFDHTGNDPCNTPTGITVSNNTDDSVTISWQTVPNAYLYHIRYRPDSSQFWQTISTMQNQYTLTSLFAGTEYEFSIEAICNSGPTGYSATDHFITTGNGYCESMGIDASHEWIDLVFIETLLNSTPDSDSGYADYTALSTSLVTGNTYDITLSAGMDIALYSEHWKVWIDFNQNNDFTDPGEEVVSYTSQQVGWETSTFTVPANALNGITKMRVSMKNGGDPVPCEIFPLGEAEDYSLNIGSITNTEEPTDEIEIYIYPNPALNSFNIKLNFNGKSEAKIFSTEGKIILSAVSHTGIFNFNTDGLSKGIYFVKVEFDNNKAAYKKLMIR